MGEIHMGATNSVFIAVTLIVVASLATMFFILVMPPLASTIIESHSDYDITAEYNNASSDHGRECNAFDRYSEWSRYICIYDVGTNLTAAERSRGANSKAREYFAYTYIFDNTSVHLEPNKLYLVKYQIQLGYCKGHGMVTTATKVADSCNECTVDPNGRQQGCCAETGCNSPDGRVS